MSSNNNNSHSSTDNCKENHQIQHGNFARIEKGHKIEPVYQTITITSKRPSNVHSKEPVSPVLEENVVIAKHEVDANHK